MSRIYLPGPIVATIHAACRQAGLNAMIRESGDDTVVIVYGSDGLEAASIRLTSETNCKPRGFTHSVTCTQATAVRELWRVLSEVITAHVAF